MITRVQISALIAVPLVSVAISLLLAGETLSWTWLKSFGSAVSVTFVVVTLFDRWIWKFPKLQNWFVKRPIVVGNWKFVIDSNWVNPQMGRCSDPLEARVIIRQTYTQLYLHLETSESSGDLSASKIIMKDDGTYQIFGVFQNRPHMTLIDQSRPHLGTLMLDVIGDSSQPCMLRGIYWTDRGTRGDMQGERI